MKTFLKAHSVYLAVMLWHANYAGAANWPAWRGPEGMGVAKEKNLPLRWGTNENVRWRTPLPERGNSTPIVWGNRVFVTQAIEAEKRRVLMCFDRATGKLLWQQGPVAQASEPTHETNPQGSSSPVTDGERVIAWFGAAGLYCYDFKGRELWHRDLGPQKHIWGWGSSPMLHGNVCYLNFGPGEPSFLVALDKKTGREVWRVAEPNADSGGKKPGQEKAAWVGSWSTPVLIKAGGREELILSWPKRVVAFEPKTGKELWICAGLNPLAYTSPLFDKDRQIIVAMGGYNGMSLAVKAGGTGDATETRRLWHHPKTKQRIGSGVLHDGHIYILNDPGVAECFELETGKLVWARFRTEMRKACWCGGQRITFRSSILVPRFISPSKWPSWIQTTAATMSFDGSCTTRLDVGVQTFNSILAGVSMVSLMRRRKSTASRPSTIR